MSDDYANFDSLIDDVVKAAIYADLWMNGWAHNPDGTVFYAMGGLGSSEPYNRPGPGQGYPPDNLSPNGNASPGDDGYLRDPATTLGDVYRTWEAAIPPLFEPFRGLPDPAFFQDRADDVRLALMQLSSRGSRGDGTSTDTGRASANVDYDGNSTLALASQAAQQLNSWQGRSAVAFATYLNVFEVVVGNQAMACEALRVTLLEEKELWTRMRADAVDFAIATKDAFGRCGDIFVGDVKALLSVVGTINTVLGWFPAFKPATTVAGKALTVTGIVVDTFGGQDPPENDLASRGPFDVLHKCQKHRDELVKKSQTVEGDIEATLVNLIDHINQAPKARPDGGDDQASYTLARPDRTFSADSVDDFVTDPLHVPWQNVNDTADLLDHDLAPEMRTAATSLDSGDSIDGWYRSDGQIGTGTFGCWSRYFNVSELIRTEVRETAHEMGWAAEMLRDIVRVMKGTDDSVRDDFKQVRGKIHDFDNPVPPVTYGGFHVPLPY